MISFWNRIAHKSELKDEYDLYIILARDTRAEGQASMLNLMASYLINGKRLIEYRNQNMPPIFRNDNDFLFTELPHKELVQLLKYISDYSLIEKIESIQIHRSACRTF